MDLKTAMTEFLNKFIGKSNDEILNYMMPIAKFINKESKEFLFHEGDNANYIYFLISGNVKLSKYAPNGKEIVIKIVNNHELFAEATLYGINKYPVNATVINKAEILGLSIEGFKKICLTKEEFLLNLFTTMSHRLRYLVEMINDLVAADTMQRLTKYINSLSESKNSNTFKLPISKKDLALLLGAAPETVSRLFIKLQNDGFITLEGRNITILKKLNIEIIE